MKNSERLHEIICARIPNITGTEPRISALAKMVIQDIRRSVGKFVKIEKITAPKIGEDFNTFKLPKKTIWLSAGTDAIPLLRYFTDSADGDRMLRLDTRMSFIRDWSGGDFKAFVEQTNVEIDTLPEDTYLQIEEVLIEGIVYYLYEGTPNVARQLNGSTNSGTRLERAKYNLINDIQFGMIVIQGD